MTTPDKKWSILYRGPLSSCNYACDYCPFAKTKNTRAELADDARRLERFVEWVRSRSDVQIGVLFTPWGEALIRSHYRDALVELSQMPNVDKVAIQTNLSVRSYGWVEDSDKDHMALWATYHPPQVDRDAFLKNCRELDARGVRYSVGVVGLREHFGEIEALREALSPDVYLWVNAYKREPDYYTPDDVARIERVDPLFSDNTVYHPSRGDLCRAGASVFSVDGDGDARRCHFIDEVIGNIYADDIDDALYERACTNDCCGCHIGYIHLDRLERYPVYGDGLLERIPAEPIWR
jgi:MoaA/NifB/PqqE/SkfB family radical SAM enzyme